MGFGTDVTNRQWALVCDLFDPPGRRGAPARIHRRRMVNTVLDRARTGCEWRYLPPQFGPWSAVWQQFRRWRDRGVWAEAMDRLLRADRGRHGRFSYTGPQPGWAGCSTRRSASAKAAATTR